MAVYGHKHLNLFFRPLLDVSENGFSFKGRSYSWSDIRSIESEESEIAYDFAHMLGAPKTTITLSNGSKVKIDGRVLEKEGESYFEYSDDNATPAYRELLYKLKVKTGDA